MVQNKNKIFEWKYLKFFEGTHTDIWEAIRNASQPLKDDGCITENWFKSLKTLTSKYGYYFILTDDMAFPHISPCDETIKDSLGFYILKNPVTLNDENHKNKKIKFILTLISTTGDGHMDLLQKIIELWNDSDWLELIGSINCQEEMKKIEKFQIDKFGSGE